MLNMLDEAIIYATIMHQGKVRKFRGTPFILHPIEVAQILSTMTEDQEIISAGILHDVVEETDGTLDEIEKRFGKRVADLVASDSERKYDEDMHTTWKRRKEDALRVLKNSRDLGVEMLWLSEQLANIRSIAGMYSEIGDEIWSRLNESDPDQQCWYYRSIAEIVELDLNKTGAFKEFIKHINFIWPGTFDASKSRFRKYKEVSVEGCRLIGWGAKGSVFRYDDEMIVKVFNRNNTYKDVEREVALARRAFILGVPTAISFGIVSVVGVTGGEGVDESLPAFSKDMMAGTDGHQYGAMYELLDSDTVSRYIQMNPQRVESYAVMMADLARVIHGISVEEEDTFPPATDRLLTYVSGGVGYEDEILGEKCIKLIKDLPDTGTLVHGDFHTGNVFLLEGQPLLIDMDRLSTGHPIAEIAGLYYFYVVLGENDPKVVEKYMGFSYDTALRFFDAFLKRYLDTTDETRLREVTEKASLLCYMRMIRKIHKKTKLSEEDRKLVSLYLEKIRGLTEKLDTLAF